MYLDSNILILLLDYSKMEKKYNIIFIYGLLL